MYNENINYKEKNLSELVAIAQNNDLRALEELIKREQNSIYVTLCYLDNNDIDVFDLTQEVLIKMSKNIKTLKNPDVFKSWLNQIVIHVFYDALRKKSKEPTFFSIDDNEQNIDFYFNQINQIADKSSKPDEKSLSNELEEKIKQSIYNLPLSFRIPIILREFQGMTYEEIANSLNTNIGTIKSRIARARNKLQEELKPYIA